MYTSYQYVCSLQYHILTLILLFSLSQSNIWMTSRYNVMIIGPPQGLTVCVAQRAPLFAYALFFIGLNEIQYESQICEDAQPSTKTLPIFVEGGLYFP